MAEGRVYAIVGKFVRCPSSDRQIYDDLAKKKGKKVFQSDCWDHIYYCFLGRHWYRLDLK